MTEALPAALAEAIRRFGEAWASGDVEVLETLLSPTYTHGTVTGKLQDRAAWLAYAATRSGRQTRIRFSNVQTRVIGDVAIVTGRNDVEGRGDRPAREGENRSLLFTQVWVRRGGNWQREAFHGTYIPSSEGSSSL